MSKENNNHLEWKGSKGKAIVSEIDTEKAKEDCNFDERIILARTDKEEAFKLYREFVSKAKTIEERIKRINEFRCGGW